MLIFTNICRSSKVVSIDICIFSVYNQFEETTLKKVIVLNQTIDVIKNILETILKIEITGLKNDSNLIDDYGLDSITLMYFVIQLEEVFEVTLPDDFFTLEKLSSVGKIVAIIEELSNK